MRERPRGRIESLLHVGKENAIKSGVLQVATELDKRTLQAAIAKERESGAMICGYDGGYYIARDEQEAAEYYKQGTAKALKLLHTLRHIRRYSEGIKGQEKIDPDTE